MELKGILPLYEKYSKRILFTTWFLFTSIFCVGSILTKGENATILTIFIVSLVGWGAIVLYLGFSRLFGNNKNGDVQDLFLKEMQSRILRVLDIAFVLLITSLLWILQIYDARPIAYYILITVLLGCLVLSILIATSKISHLMNIFKVLVFSALSSMAVFKQFYLAGMIDIGYFSALNEVTANLGHIPIDLAGKQLSYPLAHVATAISKILTSSDIQVATICAVVLPSIILTLCVYAIARHFLGPRYGLVAMLIVNLPAYVIYLRYQANPTEWGWINYLILLFIIFLWVRSKGKLYNRFGLMLLSFIMLMTAAHQFSSFVFLFILCSLYISSVLINGKIVTRFLPLLLIYSLFLLIYWNIVPVGGLDTSVSAMWSGLTSIKGENPMGLDRYIGIEDPSIFEHLLQETPMVIIHCICLLLPLLLLASKSKLSEKSGRKSFLWAIIITLIGGLGFFSIIWIGYTGMTIRIGIYLAVIFALGLAYLFAEFSSRAGTKPKKVMHGAVVIVIICLIGFVNIAAPMINDDTRLWNTDTTITAEWSYADVASAETLTNILPEQYLLRTDWMYEYPLGYYSEVKKYTENRYLSNNAGKWYSILMAWDADSYDYGTYILYREKMMTSPNYIQYRYGNTELESFGQIGYLNQNYQNILEADGNKLYDIGDNILYQISN